MSSHNDENILEFVWRDLMKLTTFQESSRTFFKSTGKGLMQELVNGPLP